VVRRAAEGRESERTSEASERANHRKLPVHDHDYDVSPNERAKRASEPE